LPPGRNLEDEVSPARFRKILSLANLKAKGTLFRVSSKILALATPGPDILLFHYILYSVVFASSRELQRPANMTKLFFLALVLAITNTVRAATAAEWRSRSIYQVVTDRYALTNNSISAPCDPSMSVYCGGSWEGIINNLDYIQNMGFDAVRKDLYLGTH
jgi:hypothetical protein